MRKEVVDAVQRCERRGHILPRTIVDTARDPKSSLHGEFEWNDAKAADIQRLERARELIRAVTLHVKLETRVVTVPAYVRDPHAASREQGYVAVGALQRDKEGSRLALLREFSQAGAHLKRARDLAAVLGMPPEEIADMVDTVGKWEETLTDQVHGGTA